MECLFCRIIAGQEKAWLVYEDENHLAFLTPFPNTQGFTVLVTREHLSSNVLELGEERFLEFLITARIVARKLNKKLGTVRTGLVIEGMGVDHAHIKLIPMHGIREGEWNPILSNEHPFGEQYEGFLTTHDGPRMGNAELDMIRERITS